jgi:hypothetical protein
LENLVNDDMVISRAWESVRENMKIVAMESLGYHELKQHKPWFDEECSKLLDPRKQVRLQWLQNLSQTNEGNVKNVRHETSRIFRRKTANV